MKKIRDLNWKIAGTFYIALVLMATPFTAHAYIDPSVSSYLIQAVAGIVVAVGAFVAIYWRRAKKKVTGYGCLFFVGLLFLIVGILLTVRFSRLYP